MKTINFKTFHVASTETNRRKIRGQSQCFKYSRSTYVHHTFSYPFLFRPNQLYTCEPSHNSLIRRHRVRFLPPQICMHILIFTVSFILVNRNFEIKVNGELVQYVTDNFIFFFLVLVASILYSLHFVVIDLPLLRCHSLLRRLMD